MTLIHLERKEWDLIRQWFNSVQDNSHPDYLDKEDYKLAEHIHGILGLRVPSSIKNGKTKRKENKMESKKYFRGGDKVVIADSDRPFNLGEVISGENEIGRLLVECGNTRFHIDQEYVYHDPDRKILPAVMKTIKENSEPPKRMVKRYLNCFVLNGQNRWNVYPTKEEAENKQGENYVYMVKAQEVEVEELSTE